MCFRGPADHDVGLCVSVSLCLSVGVGVYGCLCKQAASVDVCISACILLLVV